MSQWHKLSRECDKVDYKKSYLQFIHFSSLSSSFFLVSVPKSKGHNYCLIYTIATMVGPVFHVLGLWLKSSGKWKKSEKGHSCKVTLNSASPFFLYIPKMELYKNINLVDKIFLYGLRTHQKIYFIYSIYTYETTLGLNTQNYPFFVFIKIKKKTQVYNINHSTKILWSILNL